METNLNGIVKVVELPKKDENGKYPPNVLYLLGSPEDTHFAMYVSSMDGNRLCPCMATNDTPPETPNFNFFSTSNG